MNYSKEKLPVNKKLYKKLNNICTYNNLKLEFKNGLVFKIEDTNINFIEPHRFVIKIKDIALVLLCYDNLNLCLYKKDNLVNIPIIKKLIFDIKRIEKIRDKKEKFKKGYAIFITNDLGYLDESKKTNCVYKQFALVDNSIKSGILSWEKNASKGTKKNREESIIFKDSYKLKWKCYSNSDNDNGKFMYLINEIK